MAMNRHVSVDTYMENQSNWREELEQLRTIINSTDLEETVKWGAPCYTFNGKNVVGIGGFKSYFGLWFFQGALLQDKSNVLINAQEGRTKALRQWRFGSKKEIKPRLIRQYIKEAIELQATGKEIKPARNKPLAIPTELETALSKNKKAAASFKKLPKGKQREFAEHIADAKRGDTKERRLKKILPMISRGEGLSDKYRNC